MDAVLGTTSYDKIVEAVEEALAIVLPQLEHGLRILKGSAHDCARK